MSKIKANQVLLKEENFVGADLKAWESVSGLKGLKAALKNVDGIVGVIKEAGLRGLGGSGFPAHIKWQAVKDQTSAEKYLICNGNEDEPGTFKDEAIMSRTPHQIVEGSLIAALGVGANKIVYYINPHAEASMLAMGQAVKEWYDSDHLKEIETAMGGKIELKVHPSPGIYIGGEETAAISAVEGGFPFPRRKPPFPAESGVHGLPTLINNMESLANVGHILANGAQWFRNLGLGHAVGTKIFSLSGDVLRPGTYELPKGTPLKTLIEEFGGGMLQGKKLKAIFMGGPSNTLLTPENIDVPLDFDSVKERNAGLGTGAVIVMSEGSGVVKKVAEYVEFFANSSCGQCPPCKTGTLYLSSLLEKIDTGHGTGSDLARLKDLVKILPGSGICHLVNGAATVVQSSLDNFEEEYKSAIENPSRL